MNQIQKKIKIIVTFDRCESQKGGISMRKYKLAALSTVVFIVALLCASHTSLVLFSGCFLLFFIPQVILVGLQCLEVVYDWREFKDAEEEAVFEKVSFTVLCQENISYTPFVMTLRTMIVMLGINPERAGPSFAM